MIFITQEEWKSAEKALENLYGSVTMNIDGYEVYVALCRVSTYKAELAIYINGKFKGEWLIKECEERKRFLQCSEKRLFPEKEIKKLGATGKYAKELRVKKYYFYKNTWSSFRSLKRHLIANNREIKLIEIKGV